MKIKIITLFLVFSFCFNNFAIAGSYIDRQIKASKNNVKYSSVEKYKTDPINITNKETKKTLEIKDPKLIKFKEIKTIPESDYNKKIAQDKLIYKNAIIPQLKKKTNSVNVNPQPVDFYNLYRITEKLIRANQLDYVNWRIAVRKSTKDYNAESLEANLIIINTALYDSLYSNPDALAFIIGHEFAHQILGHAQRETDIAHRDEMWYNALLVTTFGLGLGIYVPITTLSNQKEHYSMEYMADALSIEFLTKAGFNAEKAMEAVNIMNALPYYKSVYSRHPLPEKRIENIKETIKYLSPSLIKEGQYNIYNSEVLDCKKSSDRVSIVITKPNKQRGDYYSTETSEEILKRIAYIDYKNGDMKKAIKNFKRLAKLTESYVPYLYISYAYEYLYNETQKENYIKMAKKAAYKAMEFAQNDKNVKKQLKDIEEDL